MHEPNRVGECRLPSGLLPFILYLVIQAQTILVVHVFPVAQQSIRTKLELPLLVFGQLLA
jgi:hypothetical protein